MEHLTVQGNGAGLHVARIGVGRPLLLLHGWPEFWLTWEPVMARLRIASRFLRPTCAASATATNRKDYSDPTSRPPTCWR